MYLMPVVGLDDMADAETYKTEQKIMTLYSINSRIACYVVTVDVICYRTGVVQGDDALL